MVLKLCFSFLQVLTDKRAKAVENMLSNFVKKGEVLKIDRKVIHLPVHPRLYLLSFNLGGPISAWWIGDRNRRQIRRHVHRYTN